MPASVANSGGEASCAGSMFSSSYSKSTGSSAFGSSLFVWLRRVLTLPTEADDTRQASRPSGERLSCCNDTPETPNATDSIDIVVRDEKPNKHPRTAAPRTSAAAAMASSAEAPLPRKARTAPPMDAIEQLQQRHRQPLQQQPPSQQQQQPQSRPAKTPVPGVASCSVGQQAKCPPSAATTAPPASSAGTAAAPPAPPPPPPTAPAPAPAAIKREVSMRNYVIGGLNFEVDARYRMKSIVGKGAYGLVCAAEDLCPSPKQALDSPVPTESGAPPSASEPAAGGKPPAPTMVAVKKVLDPFHDHTDCKRLLREIRLLRCLRHPNVLHLTDIMPARSPAPSDWKDVYLVTRLFDTNLHRVIYSGHSLTDAHIQYILWQVFRALRYLHAAGVVHRDMKPTNLLLNRDCELALADFGLARHMPHHLRNKDGGCASATASSAAASSTSLPHSSEDLSAPPPERSKAKGGQLTKYVVTRWYRAPELLVQNRQYDFKVDLWSTGCILAEVLGAKAIFPGKDSLHQLRLVVELLGLPSDEELGTISNAQAVSYIRNLRPKEMAATDPAAAAARFAKLYPTASPLLLDLMARLLQFDPRKRPTAAEALAHPYLAAYRDAPEEGLPTPEVEMSFEADSPSTDQLRSLIWSEVCRYHPQLLPEAGGAGGVAGSGKSGGGGAMSARAADLD